MSKREDDPQPQPDLEVGMTTAERRRRRRRGGGLRVPSDNVPRRSSPPVVAPVPEDPSLAMSIAYTFTSDASEPIPTQPHPGDGLTYPDPAAPDALSTLIDPLSGPVEQADFEMKTREMAAVDLDALGLAEQQAAAAAAAGGDGAVHGGPGMDARYRRAVRVETRPDSSEELDVDMADVEEPAAAAPPAAQRGRERLRTVALSEDDLEEVREAVRAMESADRSGVSALPEAAAPAVAPAPMATVHGQVHGQAHGQPAVSGQSAAMAGQGVVASSMPHTVSGAVQLPAAAPLSPTPAALTPVQTQLGSASGQLPVAVTGPYSPAQGQPPMGASSGQIPVATTHPGSGPLRPPPTPAHGTAAVPRPHTPTPAPPIAAPAREQRSAADDMWGEDTPLPRTPTREMPRPEEPYPRAGTSPPGAVPAPISAQPSRPISIPSPVDPSNRTQPLTALDLERPGDSSGVPEIDVGDEEDRAEGSGEFEVDVDADADAEEIKAADDAASEARRASSASATPSVAAGAPVHPAPAAAPAAAAAVPAAPAAAVAATAAKDAHAHPPPPPPAALHHHAKAPPAPPPAAKKDGAAKPPAAQAAASAPVQSRVTTDTRPARKQWFVEVFDEDYLRTLPFLTPQATQAEAEFVANAMQLTPGAQVLDVGCGYGRHAMELAARGFHIVGLDLSTPLLLRGGEEAQRRGLQINFVRGDMRELDFDAQFDGAYCLFSTFGYFDDETNKRTAANIARALKPGGRVLIEILNRDYVIADLPTRVWWEGDGCVVLEEVDLNYFSSRIQVNRSVVFDDGRQVEQEISIRAYSLHEVGKLMHAAGFRVLEVSGGYQTRGRFFGNQSRHIIVLAERKDSIAP